MENNSENSATGGIGFTGLLTILFIGLKLTGFINWSWFWVLSPIIFSFILVLIIVLIVVVLSLIRDKF